MITRTAIFEGHIKPGHEEHFFKEIHEKLMPLWHRFPHAKNVRLHRTVAADTGAPPILMIQQIDYPSRAAVDEALASPVRHEARAIFLELMKLFEGRFHHYLSEGGAVDG
jgi:hypothetical protein